MPDETEVALQSLQDCLVSDHQARVFVYEIPFGWRHRLGSARVKSPKKIINRGKSESPLRRRFNLDAVGHVISSPFAVFLKLSAETFARLCFIRQGQAIGEPDLNNSICIPPNET